MSDISKIGKNKDDNGKSAQKQVAFGVLTIFFPLINCIFFVIIISEFKRKEGYLMNKKSERIVALALACITSVGIALTPTVASASTGDSESIYYSSEARTKNYIGTLGIYDKNASSYQRFDVTIGGVTLSVRGFRANGIDYIPFRAAANALGANYSYSASSKTAVMTASGLTLRATAGCYVSYANERTLFEISPTVLMNDGRLYIPASIFAKSVGMKASFSGSALVISGRFSPILSADKYYREDEVYWLSRIISAESSGEPLVGQIAVGNVVLNRRNSPEYPNTIYGVIFDRKYGVQFSPILNGTIYQSPTYNSVLAAKICLEGYDLSDGALFFLEPRLSTSSWIPQNRPYLFTVGRHDFYR